jgi:hypothetical protein
MNIATNSLIDSIMESVVMIRTALPSRADNDGLIEWNLMQCPLRVGRCFLVGPGGGAYKSVGVGVTRARLGLALLNVASS